VLGVATARGHARSVAPDPRDLDVCDRSGRPRLCRAASRRDRQLRRLDRRRRGRVVQDAAQAVSGQWRTGLLARSRRRHAAPISCTSRPTTSSRATLPLTRKAPRPYVESDSTGPRSVYGRDQAGRRAPGAGRLSPPRGRAHRLAVRRRMDATSSPPCCARERGRDAVQVVTDQVGSPTVAGHLAPALLGLRARDSRPHPSRRRGPGLLERASPARSSARPSSTAACEPADHEAVWRARAASRRGRCWRASDPMCAAAALAGRARYVPRAARVG
jgi:hypothetical protein